jgi:hypothetical protein
VNLIIIERGKQRNATDLDISKIKPRRACSAKGFAID